MESLRDWLAHEPALRGHVTLGRTPVREGEMGAEVFLAIAVAAPPIIRALSQAVTAWLAQCRSETTIELTGPDGTRASVTNKGPTPPEQLLAQIRAALEPSASSGSSLEE
jgi:Effector Associated Constant Component 1